MARKRKALHHTGSDFSLARAGLGKRLTRVDQGPTDPLQDWMRVVYRGLNNLDAVLPKPLDPESAEALRSLGYAD